jgi:hypothetical protein
MKRKKECFLRKIGQIYMLVPIEEKRILLERIISINETGAYLWNLMEQDITKEEMLCAMQKEYAIDEAVAESDLTEFLEKMQAAGMLEPAAGPYI